MERERHFVKQKRDWKDVFRVLTLQNGFKITWVAYINLTLSFSSNTECTLHTLKYNSYNIVIFLQKYVFQRNRSANIIENKSWILT